jgi:hypothetical protein
MLTQECGDEGEKLRCEVLAISSSFCEAAAVIAVNQMHMAMTLRLVWYTLRSG